MREIKFRAWHEQGFMLDVENIVKLNLEEEMLEYCVLNEDGVRSDRECCFYEIELMQFTGLKDKNGKEIYEGDIIEKTYYSYHQPECSEIFKIIYNGLGFSFEHIKGRSYHTPFTEEIEVIGNIHDNPELMEEKK